MPKPTGSNVWTRRKLVVGVLSLALAGLSLMAATGEMSTLETNVFEWIYSMPDSLRWFALLATQLGNFWVVIGIVGLLFVVRWNPRLSLTVFRNSVLTYIVIQSLKLLINRPRPMILLQEVSSREIAVFGDGFPSGHTALATVLSLTLLPYLPKRLRWLPVAWVGLVAWSRVYLGVHAPLDILGGIVIGMIVVIIADAIPWPAKNVTKKR